MRVTFVMPELSLSGGVKVVAIHAKALRQRGHAVQVVYTPAKPKSGKDRLRRIVKGNRAQQWTQGGRTFFDQSGVNLHQINRWRPVRDADVPDSDVIVATWWETAEWVAQLSPSKGAKAYFIQHYETWGGPVDRVDATWRLPLHKITISRWLGKLSAEKFGDRDFSMIPNGVDLGQFHAPRRQRQDAPTVGFVYCHVGFKGCDLALKAIEMIRRRVPELRVKSFGCDTPITEMPLPANTEYSYRPAQEKIREIYSGCDAWLFTSRSEGFGLPILEAMACRTPVVGTPVGAAPELLESGGGILVPEIDSQSIANSAIELLNCSKERWSEFSDQAYATAAANTWDHSIIQMENAMAHAMEKHARDDPLPNERHLSPLEKVAKQANSSVAWFLH